MPIAKDWLLSLSQLSSPNSAADHLLSITTTGGGDGQIFNDLTVRLEESSHHVVEVTDTIIISSDSFNTTTDDITTTLDDDTFVVEYFG